MAKTKTVQTNAKGNAPGGGPIKTPAPDQISNVRSPGQAGAGQNGPQPSSVEPGKASRSQLAQNMVESVNDEGVLDYVIANGTARNEGVTDQLRNITGNVPNHPAMSGASKAVRLFRQRLERDRRASH